MIFLLSGLESCAVSKVIGLILTWTFPLLHYLSLKKTPKKVKIGQIKFDWRRKLWKFKLNQVALNNDMAVGRTVWPRKAQ